jgi:SAM-dependent methyltransferase
VSDGTVHFHAERPTDLRSAGPGHRLRYIVRELPAGLERLAADLRVPAGGRVLDYGCADVPYRHFFAAGTDYVAADIPGNPDATLELNADGTVPLEDASVDAVLSTQVLEHVTEPDQYLAECFRVLRPGGRMLLSTHGLMVYHPDPDDYWRWTCAGLRRAVSEAGFEVVRFEGIMGLAASAFQLLQDAVYFRLPRLVRPACAFVLQSLAALADRLESRESRAVNALVFALVAEKP